MEHRRPVASRVYVRCVRRAFLLTVFTCGMTCWLLYTSGCCLLEPSSPLALPDNTPDDDNGVGVGGAIDLAFRGTLEWESGTSTGAHVRRLRADEDGLFIVDKGRRGRRRVQLHAYFAAAPERAASASTSSSADSAVMSTSSSSSSPSWSEVTPTKPWYRRNVTATRKHPQALIIGVKKGGTRALLEFIRLHPDVRAVGPETHFFDRHYDRGLDWYRRQMPPTLEGQMTMEKTPSYFITREVPVRIYNMSRETRLLVVVRDPVTRAISDYAQTASKRRDMRSFEELTFLNASSGLVDTTWSAIKIGVYAKHLDRWLQFFPLKHFHFVSGENLIKDPAGEMAKVQDFLGLRRVITENHFYFNETKGFPCLKKSEGNGSPRCLGKTKGRVHPSIDSATIQRLRDFYRPFNLKFYQMTNIDFGWP